MALTGRVAIVTGAARGIGAALPAGLALEGAAVGIFDVDGDAAEATAARLRGDHGNGAVGAPVDVACRADVEAGLGHVEQLLGPVDILVNNAGVDVIQPFLETKDEDWDRILSVNLKGLFTCCHVMVPTMIARGSGKVVNIGSDAGRVGSSGEAVYSATKGGVIAFTKTLAREVAPAGGGVQCG